MNMNNYDVIIIGAGPAGLNLSRELAKSNFKILLLDKKQSAQDVKYDTSGSFIDPKEWNLPPYLFNPISRMSVFSKNEDFCKNVNAYVINRKELLSYMEVEARKNNNFFVEYGAIITDISLNQNGVDKICYKKNGEDRVAMAKIFADCSGTGVVLGRKLGVIPNNPVISVGAEYLVSLKTEQHSADLFLGNSFEGGYGWIFPKNETQAIIGFGTLLEDKFPRVEDYLKRMWQEKRVQDRCDEIPLEKKVAVLRTGKPLRKFNHKNVVFIGDCALQANPIVGEGVRFVMEAAKLAATSIIKSLNKDNLFLLDEYSNEWNKKYYRRYKLAFLIQQKVKDISRDDNKIDRIVKKMNTFSDKEFSRFLSGDIGYLFLAKIFLKYLLG